MQENKPRSRQSLATCSSNTADKITDLRVMSVDTRPLILVITKTVQSAGADQAASNPK